MVQPQPPPVQKPCVTKRGTSSGKGGGGVRIYFIIFFLVLMLTVKVFLSPSIEGFIASFIRDHEFDYFLHE